LPEEVRGGGTRSESPDLDAQVDAFERRIIEMALKRNEGVIRRAARDLRVNAVTLARKVRRHGLDKRESG
jgi:two-component system, NtrC family, response regulator HupR/HoxA